MAYDAIFNDGTLLQQEELAAYDSLNALYGYSSADDFEEEVSATDFIDTTGLVSYGNNYNVHWGMLNNEVLYERQNKYHKPLFCCATAGASPTSCTSPIWPTRVTATAEVRDSKTASAVATTHPTGKSTSRNFTTRTPSVARSAPSIQRTATLC